MDIRCRMYMTYDIVCSYRIRHRMYVRCRMSTYDTIVCQTYDVVRLLEVVVSAVLKEPDPLPTAQANERCLSYSKSFIFSLATSKTVSETRSLWCSSTLKNGCGCGPQTSPPDQPSVQTASGSVRELHSTNLGAAGQFSLPPKGLEEGVLHVLWLHIPSETRSGCGRDGPLFEQILLEWVGRG
jgi:hypothetical protein